MGAIAAFVRDDRSNLERDIVAMLGAVAHRGPEAAGRAVLPDSGLALGGQLQARGDQRPDSLPAWDADHSTAAVLDGHIYNADSLRRELQEKGRLLGGSGDAEILVHGYQEWGCDLFRRLDGAFAVAIWQREQGRLVLARDRFGEKPLLVARLRDGYAIASELRQLLTLPEFEARLDVLGLDQYLALRRPMAPRTLVEGVQMLPAGHYATLDQSSLVLKQYWQMSFQPRPWNWPELLDALDATLNRAMQKRLVNGGTPGALMSGGLDSSVIGHYLARNAPAGEAFTVGYDLGGPDETEAARANTSYLGLRHHVEILTQEKLPDVLASYAAAIDEPLTPGAVIPRYFISKIASESVQSGFVGDGGDELRMGIGKLYRLPWLKQRLPRSLRSLIEAGPAPRLMQTSSLLGRARRVFAIMRTPELRLIPALTNSLSFEPRNILSREVRRQLPADVLTEVEPVFANIAAAVPDIRYRTLASLMRISFQDDAARLLDCTARAASLDLHPLLVDRDLIDLLATVPAAMRMKGPSGENILRTLMQRHMPDELINRPKRAFAPPMPQWLRGPLRPLLLDYASSARVAAAGIFEATAITRLVDDHMSGRRDNHVPLRYFLMFELWRERWLGGKGVKPS